MSKLQRCVIGSQCSMALGPYLRQHPGHMAGAYHAALRQGSTQTLRQIVHRHVGRCCRQHLQCSQLSCLPAEQQRPTSGNPECQLRSQVLTCAGP